MAHDANPGLSSPPKHCGQDTENLYGMIPKTIHYCWLSGDPYPRFIRQCMDSWKRVMPDYRLKLWTLDNFPLDEAPAYVHEAIAHRKWAFAADYIRLYALYHEGGIYLDSDVRVVKPFDPLLDHRFFSALEYHPAQVEKDGALAMLDGEGRRVKDGFVSGIMIQAAVMGAEAGCSYLKAVMDFYTSRNFLDSHGLPQTNIVAPEIYARVAEDFGFRYRDEDQALADGVMIYRSELFAGNRHEATPTSMAIHYCYHSWKPSLGEKLRLWLKRHCPKQS